MDPSTMTDAPDQAQPSVIRARKKTRFKSSPAFSRVISHQATKNMECKTRVIGGDSDDLSHDPPAIVVEKDGDQISKIIVTCPCGRHSEIICT
jgi:hypothetical protein